MAYPERSGDAKPPILGALKGQRGYRKKMMNLLVRIQRAVFHPFSVNPESGFVFMIAACLLVPLSSLHAQATGGQPLEFMSYGAGARSLAMGAAFVGVADDASATY